MRHEYEPYLMRRHWAETGGDLSPELLKRVGFFDDGLSQDQLRTALNDSRWVTPTSHLAPAGIVLITTGAFSPFHAGHLRMLEIAKAQLEAAGKIVAGAYVTPDHDGYVSKKRGGSCVCDASTRIHLAQEGTKHVPWIAVDPWAALYQDRPLNYTTILRRTERYLKAFGRYEVVYVFGSDNAGFKDAFLPHEYVCVGRPGHGEAHPEALPVSSTEMRGGQLAYPAPTDERPYVVRGDLMWATQHWQVSYQAVYDFETDLACAIQRVWDHHPAFLSVDFQRIILANLAKSPYPHVSFDVVTGARHWVSRVFDGCTHQRKPISWMSSDLFLIPPGEYALVDDDIASGATVEYIKSQTPQVKWTDTISMTKWSVPAFFDIVDARDFLFGAKRGGLCVRKGGGVYRVPYITPWVNLMQRAKIPPHKQVQFVQDIIEANIRFFGQVPVLVGDTDNHAFWRHLGYPVDMSMEEVSMDLSIWNPNT